MRPCEAGIFFGFEAPKKAKSSKNACTCALARSHKHDGADRKRARRVEVGAEEEVVDGHTQRAPRGLRWCGTARAALRDLTGWLLSPHAQGTATGPRRLVDAVLELDDAEATTLLKLKPYLRTLGRTAQSAAGRQQHGKGAL